MSTILFFDDRRLNLRWNVTRRVESPVRKAVYVDPHEDAINTAWGYPVPFYDETRHTWLLFYNTHAYEGDRFTTMPVLAESPDGYCWKPFDTTAELPFPGRRFRHQLLPTKEPRSLHQVYRDPFAEPSRRFKGLGTLSAGRFSRTACLWVSPDGIHWSAAAGIEWQKDAPDSPTTVFWNGKRKCYSFTTRPGLNDRRIAIFETRDWATFTPPQLILQADALDTPLAELYGMPVVAYEGYFIGLLWVYHTPQNVEGQSPIKYLGGRIDCQLAYSEDGVHFHRGLREPFIANGDPGDPDAGCVHPYSMAVKEDGSLLFYASANRGEHAEAPPGSGTIVMYDLRRDGFVSLRSAGGRGMLGTTPLYWQGGEVSLNVRCGAGSVRVSVTDHAGKVLEGYAFDDCTAAGGDRISWTPVWKGGKGLGALAGKAVRLEIELVNASIYSIRGDFMAMTAGECRRFLHEGRMPEE